MKLETETSGFMTIQAWMSAAAQIGLVLELGDGRKSGDLPRSAYSELRKFRRASSMGKDQTKIIKTISRANASEYDTALSSENLTELYGDIRDGNYPEELYDERVSVAGKSF